MRTREEEVNITITNHSAQAPRSSTYGELIRLGRDSSTGAGSLDESIDRRCG